MVCFSDDHKMNCVNGKKIISLTFNNMSIKKKKKKERTVFPEFYSVTGYIFSAFTEYIMDFSREQKMCFVSKHEIL